MKQHQHHVADREHEQGREPEQMERPRTFVAPKHRGEHGKLDGLVERQPGKNFQRAERDHERVGETLQPVV